MLERLSAIRIRIKDRAAFTLAEALTATLIMLMVAAIVAAGIPAAKRAYENVVIASNAEVVLSTTINALRSELGTAKDVVAYPDGKTITYTNEAFSSRSKIYMPAASSTGTGSGTPTSGTDTSGGGTSSSSSSGTGGSSGNSLKGIAYQRYAADDRLFTQSEINASSSPANYQSPPMRFISEKVTGENLYVTFDSVSYSDGVVTFTNITVRRNNNNGDPTKATRGTLYIRVLTE